MICFWKYNNIYITTHSKIQPFISKLEGKTIVNEWNERYSNKVVRYFDTKLWNDDDLIDLKIVMRIDILLKFLIQFFALHCKYLQWKYSGKTVFCFWLQLFDCIWIAVQSMQKLRKKVVKITFYCNPNIAGGLMLKSSSKLWSLNSFYFIFSSKKSAKLTGKSSINYKYFMYRKNKNF